MTNERNNPRRYDDLLNMPHHVSVVHPHMSLYDRAAQFAPFKALTGYEDDVEEASRLTDARVEMDEDRIKQLDERLRLLELRLSDAPTVSITYFLPDERKDGGSYETVCSIVKKIDTVRGVIMLRGGREIPLDAVTDIDGDFLCSDFV